MEMFGELIPDRFQIYGRTIEVEWVDEIHDEQELEGVALYDKNKIMLRNDLDNREHVFFHELVHFILDGMKSSKSDDETFVETFSGLLHQALSTAERDGDVIDVGRINLSGYNTTPPVRGYSWTGTNGDGKAVIDNGAVG